MRCSVSFALENLLKHQCLRSTFSLFLSEGYERIAHAREGTTMSASNGTLVSQVREDIFSDGPGTRVGSFPASESTAGDSNLNIPTAHVSSGSGGDAYDMFGEDDENTTSNLPLNGDVLGPQAASASMVSSQNMESEGNFLPKESRIFSWHLFSK